MKSKLALNVLPTLCTKNIWRVCSPPVLLNIHQNSCISALYDRFIDAPVRLSPLNNQYTSFTLSSIKLWICHEL